MAKTGQLVVEFIASTAQYQADLGKAAAQAEASARRIDRTISDLKRKSIDAGKAVLGAFGVSLGIEGAIRAFETLKDKTIEEERAVAQLNAVLKATGYSAGLSAAQLDRLGESVRASSVFDDDAIRQAQTELLRFRGVQRDVFTDAIQLAPDVATALGTTLPDAAVKLGRALQDPSTGMRALRDTGIKLDEQQIDLAARLKETGDVAGAQKIVLDELRKSVGGQAESDTAGLYGSTKRLENAWDDLEKAAGKKLFGDNHSIIEGMTGVIEHLARAAKNANLDLVPFLTGQESLLSLGKRSIDALRGKAAAPTQGAESYWPTAGGKITGPTADELRAAQGELDAAYERIKNKNYADQQIALKNRMTHAAAAYQAELEEQKHFLALRQSDLSFSYAEGLTSTSDFYARQSKIIKDGLAEQESYLNKQIEAIDAYIQNTGDNKQARDEARARLLQLVNQANQARFAAGEKLHDLAQQDQRDVQQLNDKYADLRATVLEYQGDLVGAAAIRFDTQTREQLLRFRAQATSTDPSLAIPAQQALADNAALRERLLQQAGLNKAESDFAIILGEVGIAQGRIAIAQKTGAITELEALVQTSEANRARIADLTRIADAYQKVAEATGDPKALLAAELLRVKIEELASQTDLLADKFRGIFVDSFTEGLASIVDGTKSVKDAFRDMEKSIVQSISHIAAQNIAERIFGKSGAGSGVGGFFSGLFGGGAGSAAGGWLANLFGTGAPPAAMGAGFDPMGFMGFPAFAAGGDPPVGRASWVGEHGKELFVPKVAGTIVPNHVLNARRAEKSVTYNITNNTNVLPGASRQSAAQASAATAREMRINAIRNS